jgi:hypothetical protein
MERTDARSFLTSIMPTREMVDHFVKPHDESVEIPEHLTAIMCNNAKSTYDSELGWLLCEGTRGGSIDDAKGYYAYEPNGSRRVVNFPDRTCRINTYGNSFTHCDQVSDGETWQEYLAAHVQEPIRNFGVGGYSVYQAYRRMRAVEPVSPARYIILNIWDDDHFRNLDAWRSIRMGRQGRYTLPHISVDLDKGICEENENICGTPEEVYRLCDPDWVWDTFQDDPMLHAALARKGGSTNASARVRSLGALSGLANSVSDAERHELHTEAALLATRHVVELTERFARSTGKELLLVLSFSRKSVAAALAGHSPFDHSLLKWLGRRETPVIDMRDAFVRDYSHSNAPIDAYLDRYYIGHHTPAGNFFFAWAIKNRICDWLDPSPVPYL